MAFLPESYKNLPSSISELVLVKTNIGTYFFDAFIQIDHSSKLKITEHPIESGSVVADHAYMEPRELIFDIGMSDVVSSLVPGQFSDGWSRSVSAYQTLLNLQVTRTPLFVHTRLVSYQNMLISAISVPDNKDTQFGLRCSVTLRELLVSSAKTVPVSAVPQVTNTSSNGQVVPQGASESILFQLGLFGGGKNQDPTRYAWPVPGNYRVSSGFGRRIHPITHGISMHSGIDIPAALGTPVVASKGGVVILADWFGGYGKTVKVQHDSGYTLYGHNSTLTVTKGQTVEQGQIISKVGSTGNSTGNHLHFGIYENGVAVDPQKYIK